jgi:hypothetical protein
LHLQKKLEIEQKILSANDPDLVVSYNDIAAVYHHMGDYSKSLSFWKRAVTVGACSLPENDPLLLTLRKNIELLRKKL